MTLNDRWRGRLGVLALSLFLSGCISLFPKEQPVQLYRLNLPPPAAGTPTTPAAQSFAVRGAVGNFDRAAAGDHLLTVRGDKTAYIANARWVSPAQAMFEGALSERFDADAGPARLLNRGEITDAAYRLDVSVRHFEVRYDQGASRPPTVVVEISAALDSAHDTTTRQHMMFTASVPAASNSVTAIVAAYGDATAEVLGKLKAWVDAKGAGS
jgi:cholesterol transport system auxiliary component